MAFIHEDFLLSTKTARRLYHEYAEGEPILDYHCHLPPKDVAENRQFRNLFEIALEGDHYKWRAMRSNGVDERYCTGDAPPYEKFLAWARTVPHTLRNPLYHWTHLEQKRYFGIDELLNESSAPRIWDRANALLATDELRAHGILKKFRVKAVCTTDDPTDDLAAHKAIAASSLETKVFPAFRPDKALNVHLPEMFNAVGGAPGSRQQHQYREAGGFSGRAPPAARFLSPDGRPALRPRPEPRLRRFLHRGGSGGDFRQGARRTRGHAPGAAPASPPT